MAVARANPSSPTKVSEILDQLRTEIVRGRLAPGEKLRLEHLAPRFGSGRTPLREACCRLVAEGLVTSEDQRGFRVAEISRADLIDITQTRQHIEPMALRLAIQRGDAAWEAEVTAALHRLERAGSPSLPVKGKSSTAKLSDTWEQEHARFHATLVSACGSPILLRYHAQLFEQSERYRRLAVSHGQPGRDIHGEHTALVKAALKRDQERAVALLVEHIAATAERVLAAYPALV
ncbi:MAG: FCD domain-containing protein [Kofleriaceae bacterium]